MVAYLLIRLVTDPIQRRTYHSEGHSGCADEREAEGMEYGMAKDQDAGEAYTAIDDKVMEGMENDSGPGTMIAVDDHRAAGDRAEAGAAIGEVVDTPIGVALVLEGDREVDNTFFPDELSEASPEKRNRRLFKGVRLTRWVKRSHFLVPGQCNSVCRVANVNLQISDRFGDPPVGLQVKSSSFLLSLKAMV